MAMKCAYCVPLVVRGSEPTPPNWKELPRFRDLTWCLVGESQTRCLWDVLPGGDPGKPAGFWVYTVVNADSWGTDVSALIPVKPLWSRLTGRIFRRNKVLASSTFGVSKGFPDTNPFQTVILTVSKISLNVLLGVKKNNTNLFLLCWGQQPML